MYLQSVVVVVVCFFLISKLMFSNCLYLMKRCAVGSENVEYDAGGAEGFKNHYQTHFSDSFKIVFSEVL